MMQKQTNLEIFGVAHLNDNNESKDDGFFFILKNNGDFKIIEKNYYVPNGPIIIHEEQ